MGWERTYLLALLFVCTVKSKQIGALPCLMHDLRHVGVDWIDKLITYIVVLS